MTDNARKGRVQLPVLFSSFIPLALVLILSLVLSINAYTTVGDISEDAVIDVETDIAPSSYSLSIETTSYGGCVLYIYEYPARIQTTPAATEITVPIVITQSAETPQALNVFLGNTGNIRSYLAPLIAFASDKLPLPNNSTYNSIPIFFNSGGYMRSMEDNQRKSLANEIIHLLSDVTFCPFRFFPEFGKVVSGTEEAVGAWIAANLYLGTNLFRSGFQYAYPAVDTYGIIQLSQFSLEVSLYLQNSSDSVLDEMYSLNLGYQSNWDLYATSYLGLGYLSALNMYRTKSADAVIVPPNSAVVPANVNYCLLSGYTENVLNSAGNMTVELWGPAVPAGNQIDLCMESLKEHVLRISDVGNGIQSCESDYHGDCAFDERYQPILTKADVTGFVGMGAIGFTSTFLNIPMTATITQFKSAAESICSMTFSNLMTYYEQNPNFISIEEITLNLPYFCFISSYIMVLMTDGLGFDSSQPYQVLPNTQAATWTYGNMVREINQFPVQLNLSPQPVPVSDATNNNILYGLCVGIIIGMIFAFVICSIMFENASWSQMWDSVPCSFGASASGSNRSNSGDGNIGCTDFCRRNSRNQARSDNYGTPTSSSSSRSTNESYGNETRAMGSNHEDGYDDMDDEDYRKGSKGWTELIAQYSPFGTKQRTPSGNNETHVDNSNFDLSISSTSSLLHSNTANEGDNNSVKRIGEKYANLNVEDRDKTIRKFTYQNQTV